jgi:hypothetical protein
MSPLLSALLIDCGLLMLVLFWVFPPGSSTSGIDLEKAKNRPVIIDKKEKVQHPHQTDAAKTAGKIAAKGINAAFDSFDVYLKRTKKAKENAETPSEYTPKQ